MVWTVDGSCTEVGCLADLVTVIIGTDGVLAVEVGNVVELDGLCIEVGCMTDVLTVIIGTEDVLEVEVGNGWTVEEFAAGWDADDVMVEAGICAVECEMVAVGKSGRQAPLYGKVIVYCKGE